MSAARAARLFFLTRPIKILICGVVVVVAVIIEVQSMTCSIHARNDSSQEREYRRIFADVIVYIFAH